MRLHSILALLLCLPLLARDDAPRSLSAPDLQRELAVHLGQKKFEAAQWGIKVIALDSGALLFETNAQKLLKPASNTKIFTGALALDALGRDAKIRTSLLARQKPKPNGLLESDLIVYGRGDPSFSARFQDGSYSNLVGRIVQAVQAAGVKEISGDLVGDETFFTGPRFGSSWTWDDLQYYYGAEVSSLSLQDNVIDLSITPANKPGEPCDISIKPQTGYLEFVNRTRTTGTNIPASISVLRLPSERRAYISGSLPVKHGTYVDAVTVPHPAQWFLETLRESLASQGITVRGKIRTQSWPESTKLNPSGYQEIAFTESPPISEIVAKMLKPSQNLYAQLLLLQAGARSTVQAGTTEDAGIRELHSFLKRAGIDSSEVLLDEGSGLSRSCLVTPNALLSVLKYMAKHKDAEIFRDALPAPGEGTLRSRFRDWRTSPANKIELRAKTGSLRYVSTLSGYLRTAGGEKLAFSIMLNAYNGPTSARDEVETIVRMLARYGNAR